jgi:hypothetical protein
MPDIVDPFPDGIAPEIALALSFAFAFAFALAIGLTLTFAFADCLGDFVSDDIGHDQRKFQVQRKPVASPVGTFRSVVGIEGVARLFIIPE